MSGHGAQDRFAVTIVGRRSWSCAEKLAMVAEVGEGPLSPEARKHNIARGASGACEAESFSIPRTVSASAIEFVIPCGRRVIVGKDFDALALKRMIEALEPR